MPIGRKALISYMHKQIETERAALGPNGIADLLDRGKAWKLAGTLKGGGTILFPHAVLQDCGHQIAAAANACLDSGADRVLALGVLHALDDEMQDARVRVANGADPSKEPLWGIQGPGLVGREEWKREYSLLNFVFLLEEEAKRRGIHAPQLVARYPYLVGGKPERLPGIEELSELVREGAVVVITTDAFHHGIGYEDPPERALFPDRGGLDLACETIGEGMAILGRGDYWGYNQHCVIAKSDGREVGQVARYLLGPLKGRILDLTCTDTAEMYNSPPPTWVAAALVEYKKA